MNHNQNNFNLNYHFTPIAHIKSAFQTKFGVPRQSGLVNNLQSEIIFTPPYRNPDALRGLDGFSHIWLVWIFHESIRDNPKNPTDGENPAHNQNWSPTVRPPRLGGNIRLGVFATRSPFRPNPIGLSCVKLDEIQIRPDTGPVLIISGADLINHTPILDIKPYLPYADSIPDAVGGFASQSPLDNNHLLQVIIPPDLLSRVPLKYQSPLYQILSQDPRTRYHDNPDRIYGFAFANLEIKFTVENQILTVREICDL